LKRCLYQNKPMATQQQQQQQQHNSLSLPPGPLKKPLKSASSMDPGRHVKLFP
jgi:hypothetical protein